MLAHKHHHIRKKVGQHGHNGNGKTPYEGRKAIPCLQEVGKALLELLAVLRVFLAVGTKLPLALQVLVQGFPALRQNLDGLLVDLKLFGLLDKGLLRHGVGLRCQIKQDAYGVALRLARGVELFDGALEGRCRTASPVHGPRPDLDLLDVHLELVGKLSGREGVGHVA